MVAVAGIVAAFTFGDSVGSVSPPLVPLTAILLVIPATLVVANVLASGPSWVASRVHPANALRSE